MRNVGDPALAAPPGGAIPIVLGEEEGDSAAGPANRVIPAAVAAPEAGAVLPALPQPVDVLARASGEAEVLDAETPSGDAAALAERVEEYRPQLEAYRRAVAGMFRLELSEVSARLLFVGPGVVEGIGD